MTSQISAWRLIDVSHVNSLLDVWCKLSTVLFMRGTAIFWLQSSMSGLRYGTFGQGSVEISLIPSYSTYTLPTDRQTWGCKPSAWNKSPFYTSSSEQNYRKKSISLRPHKDKSMRTARARFKSRHFPAVCTLQGGVDREAVSSTHPGWHIQEHRQPSDKKKTLREMKWPFWWMYMVVNNNLTVREVNCKSLWYAVSNSHLKS